MLGRHDRPETHQRYAQLIREYVVNGYRLPTPNDASIVELLVAFVRHADGYYRRQDGTPTGETTNFRAALRPLRELYGAMQVAEFGPAQLKAVRQRVIESGACRSYANVCTRKIRHVFRWGVAEGIVLAMKSGLDARQVAEALQGGAAGSWVLENRAERMIDDDYPLGFRIALHLKDLTIALEQAREVGAALPIAALAAQIESGLVARGHGDDDNSALARAVREWSGM